MVERALRQQLAWELKRLDGIRAIDEYYQEHGYPTPEVVRPGQSDVAEEHRLADEARGLEQGARPDLPAQGLGHLMEQVRLRQRQR